MHFFFVEPIRKENTLSLLLQILLSLQQLDDKLSSIRRKKKEIPEQIQGMEKAFDEEKEQLEEHRERLKVAKSRQRELEKQLQENAEGRKKKQERLLEVKTNEEYRALLKEIGYTQEADSQTEDEILMLLEEIDSLEKTLREIEKSTAEQEERLQQDKQRLQQEILETERERRFLERERERVCGELDRDVLEDYEKIRSRRAGQAVVTVTKEVCPGCHMYVPPQTINEVIQTGEIRHCPYCRRILYCDLEESA
jgi:predicted  nucleic acid-binding Zn-ribbon protein